ncbi:MAG TPA: type VII secretion-associated serine protease mycosin [Streptosporangiaceae bacterium]|nr:type VII secretion-associated serine protease mycosin [Streptosporangiaceae bacterium]
MAVGLAARRVVALAAAALVAATLSGAPAVAANGAAANANCGSSNLPPTTLDHAMPWAQRELGLQRVWPITEGAGVIVGVVDTGVDGNQPFLRGVVLPGFDVVNGGGPADTDCDGHGTFVAGLIAGRQISGFGFSGVAPQATILPIRQANSPSDGTPVTLAKGIRAAVDRHAQVINVSITSQPTLELAEAIRYALAHDVVIVAAAGNDFGAGNAVQYPAGFPGVLAVGAVDQNGQRANFSESGPNVAITAPGTNLLGPGAGGVGLVSSAGGTSFATAYVSGVAALVRSYYPKLTAAQVIDRIEATADHPAGRLPSRGVGWGSVDPYAAVTAVLPGQRHPSVTSRTDVTLPKPPGPGSRTGQLAAGIAVGGAAIAIGILLTGGLVAAGRRRDWRPGT